MSDLDRRQFLLQLGSGAVAVIGLQVLPGCEFISVEARGTGEVAPFVTPADDGVWYWQSGQSTSKEDAPTIAPEDWALEITADGESLATIDFEQLMAYKDAGQEMSYWKTLRCVFSFDVGPPPLALVANGIFTGIPLHVVLADLNLPPGIVKLRTFGADGFTSNISLDRAMEGSGARLPVMLAYGLNGEPMTRLRGGPVRMIIPEMWGYKNMKWLSRIEASSQAEAFGKYETELFPNNPLIDESGVMALGGAVTQPQVSRASVPGPNITVAGLALAGSAAIAKVEISLDDGPFEALQLHGSNKEAVLQSLAPELQPLMQETEQWQDQWPVPNVWVTWSRLYPGLEKGSHTITVRTSDSTGRTQAPRTDSFLEVANQIRVEFTVS